jgi:hypothetical protein
VVVVVSGAVVVVAVVPVSVKTLVVGCVVVV